MYSSDRRRNYPFTNCTNCGPRFTLINDFPYDRQNSTMLNFEMCPQCNNEYTSVDDRRFHAQPISCPDCGPVYTYLLNNTIINDFDQIIKTCGQQINLGKIIAIKGLGGYNLVCDAKNSNAVNDIRQIKNREKKPLAVMCRSIKAVEKLVTPDKWERETLLSWQRPIVIIQHLKKVNFPASLTNGHDSLGIFLPYLPLHYLLFDNLKTDAIIVTSGNESDTPILYEDEEAMEKFHNISGGILTHNRKIARRIDDSVVKVVSEKPSIIRRARGYAPSPVELNFLADGIFAAGAELSNCFCIGKDRQAIASQHIGDLKNADTYAFYQENIKEFSRIYRFKLLHAACDLHPDYLSTRYAINLNVPVTRVQHHHAHIAAVMAEYSLTKPVIGLSYDGTGYGTDGNIWGSEVLIADYKSFERYSHFEYVPLPGGDLAVKQPWRSALAYLYHAYGNEWTDINIPFSEQIDIQKANALTDAIDKNINSPLCCSAGRLFDSIAGILTICMKSEYHAQAPMMLENFLDGNFTKVYPYSSYGQISFISMIHEIIEDIKRNISLIEIVTSFHNTIADAALKQVTGAYNKCGIKDVIISGGTFQNRYLTEKLVFLLKEKDFRVFLPAEMPVNDGGIALGQLAVAAHLNQIN
jgi:hydrogenase maturation protein HypF